MTVSLIHFYKSIIDNKSIFLYKSIYDIVYRLS